MAITKDEILDGRNLQYPDSYTPEISGNIDKLLVAMNVVRTAYDTPMFPTSGWRPGAINDNIPGAAKKSAHTLGMAVDIKDTDGKLWKWCLENLQLLKDNGIYLEDKRWTPTWVHFQIRKIPSGNRIFRAYADNPPNPDLWDGVYDKKFND